LFVVDTLRADHCTPYGYLRLTTPRLKEFAAQGALFETAIPQASFTMASMGTLFTSTYPHHHGAGRHPSLLESRNITLAETFRTHGYTTAAFVTNPLLGPGSGFEQGFDHYQHLEEKDTQGAEGLIRRATVWIKEHQEETFFLWLHVLDPHFPYIGRSEYLLVDDAKARREYQGLLRRKRSGQVAMGEIFFQCDLSPAAVREGVNAYDSEIGFVDHHFGILLDALEELGLGEKTLVVFTSDHGESLGEHGLFFSHGFSVYDEALKVPLVMRLPGFETRGKRIREPVQLLDLMPTLMGLTGMDPLENLKGRDMTPLIYRDQDPAAFESLPAFSESEPMYLDQGKRRYSQRKRIYLEGDMGKWKAVRTERYKMIWIPKEGGSEVELYDILSDPMEHHDLSQEKPQVVQELYRLLQSWLADPSRRESVTLPELDEEWAERLQGIGYIK
jgi:arylsulfatase A-like enzyme